MNEFEPYFYCFSFVQNCFQYRNDDKYECFAFTLKMFCTRAASFGKHSSVLCIHYILITVENQLWVCKFNCESHYPLAAFLFYSISGITIKNCFLPRIKWLFLMTDDMDTVLYFDWVLSCAEKIVCENISLIVL